jgi:hypothetical protein
MYELEHLVEESVNLLADSGADPWELRSMYAALYRFEHGWDTSFTHFQHLEQLMAARFAYRARLSEHPDYEAHPEYFDGLSAFALITPPGVAYEWPPGNDGYTEPPNLYFDAGSRLWRRMVSLGRLTGRDAEPPRELPLPDVALRVAMLAEEQGDRELIARWYRMLTLEMDIQAEPADLAQDPTLTALRAIVARTDAMSLPMSGSLLGDPGPDVLDEYPMLRWWYVLPPGAT